MKARQTDTTVALDRAIEWIEQLKESDAESEGFIDWLTDSPRHVEAFMQAMTLEQRLAALPLEHWALDTPCETNAAGSNEATNVVQLAPPAVSVPRSPSRRKHMWLLAAGVAALALCGGMLMHVFSDSRNFTTAIGEQRIIQLQDGSIVNLNTDSRIKVRMSAKGRDIQLLQGQALFKVHQDAARPFRVHAGDSIIQAVGTQFDVYRRAQNVTVAVIEGRVRVTPGRSAGTRAESAPGEKNSSRQDAGASAMLSTGEQLDIRRDGRIVHRPVANLAQATAWQQRRLMFDEETLANIVAEFNRYNRQRFHIDDAKVAQRRFSGIFDADAPESLAQLLARDSGLTVEYKHDEILIRAGAGVPATPDTLSSKLD